MSDCTCGRCSCGSSRPLTVSDLDLPKGISKAEARRQTFDGVLIFCVFAFSILYAVYKLVDEVIRAIF